MSAVFTRHASQRITEVAPTVPRYRCILGAVLVRLVYCALCIVYLCITTE
jgi:hypothetical protein